MTWFDDDGGGGGGGGDIEEETVCIWTNELLLQFKEEHFENIEA